MIDTIKLQIPISRRQFEKLYDLVETNGRDQWAIVRRQVGEIVICRNRDVIESDLPSYRHEINWDIPDRYQKNHTALTVEFSLPKYWYGHNVRLLYDWQGKLNEFRLWFGEALGLGRYQLPKIETWKVKRCDFCYAWRLPSQEEADALIDVVKRLKYPYKKGQHYAHTAFWPGSTYSVKVYAKYHEFQANSVAKLIKADADPGWVAWLERESEGVVRFEITGRWRWLKDRGIKTVKDLMQTVSYCQVTSELWEWAQSVEGGEPVAVIQALLPILAEGGYVDFSPEAGIAIEVDKPITFPELRSPPLGDDGTVYSVPGGTIISRAVELPTYIVQEYLKKLVGEGDMSMKDQVELKLKQHYKSDKALRLMGFWLYVREFGLSRGIATFSKPTYYRNRSDLEKAGVYLLEKSDRLIKVDFKMQVPSDRVVNRHDDFRDHQNILNFSDRTNKQA